MSELTRRRFLQRSFAAAPLIALAPAVPSFLAASTREEKDRSSDHILVIVELAGGNDGINTVVPFADEGYARARKILRLPQRSLIRLNDEIGLHPAMAPLARTWESSQLAIVQGVGYPNPSRSHFESQAVWHTARRAPVDHQGVGWLGRTLDGDIKRQAPAVFIGQGPVPVALRGRLSSSISLDRPADCRFAAELPGRGLAEQISRKRQGDDLLNFARRTALDAYKISDFFHIDAQGQSKEGYPTSNLGRRLQLVARMIKSGLKASTYYVVHGGDADSGSFDTHSNQLQLHGLMLAEFAASWQAFLADLKSAGLEERVVLLAFSEFGRRPDENGSGGTDHGTAGPVFLAGGRVRGGLIGAAPQLLDLENGDLKWSIDFRQIYATILENWLGVQKSDALFEGYKKLSLFHV